MQHKQLGTREQVPASLFSEHQYEHVHLVWNALINIFSKEAQQQAF